MATRSFTSSGSNRKEVKYMFATIVKLTVQYGKDVLEALTGKKWM